MLLGKYQFIIIILQVMDDHRRRGEEWTRVWWGYKRVRYFFLSLNLYFETWKHSWQSDKLFIDRKVQYMMHFSKYTVNTSLSSNKKRPYRSFVQAPYYDLYLRFKVKRPLAGVKIMTVSRCVCRHEMTYNVITNQNARLFKCNVWTFYTDLTVIRTYFTRRLIRSNDHT